MAMRRNLPHGPLIDFSQCLAVEKTQCFAVFLYRTALRDTAPTPRNTARNLRCVSPKTLNQEHFAANHHFLVLLVEVGFFAGVAGRGGHDVGDGVAVASLDGGVGLLAAAHALHPVCARGCR